MKFIRTLSAALLCVPLAAMAVDFEVGVGSTKFGQTDNGIWYQNGFDHTLDLQSPSYSLGVSGYVTPSTRWRVEYAHLGNVTAHAKGVPDADYNGVNGCRAACPPLYTYHTEASVRGVSFTVAPEWDAGHGYKVFVEVGAFVFLPKFLTQAKANADADYTWRNEYREGWQVGPQIGGGVQYKNTQLVFTAYNIDSKTPDINAIPNYQGWAYNLKIRQLF